MQALSAKLLESRGLARHAVTHSTERPWICEICGGGFKLMDNLKFHIKRNHGTIEKNHVCAQCGKRFHDKHPLDLHMLTHTGQV